MESSFQMKSKLADQISQLVRVNEATFLRSVFCDSFMHKKNKFEGFVFICFACLNESWNNNWIYDGRILEEKELTICISLHQMRHHASKMHSSILVRDRRNVRRVSNYEDVYYDITYCINQALWSRKHTMYWCEKNAALAVNERKKRFRAEKYSVLEDECAVVREVSKITTANRGRGSFLPVNWRELRQTREREKCQKYLESIESAKRLKAMYVSGSVEEYDHSDDVSWGQLEQHHDDLCFLQPFSETTLPWVHVVSQDA